MTLCHCRCAWGCASPHTVAGLGIPNPLIHRAGNVQTNLLCTSVRPARIAYPLCNSRPRERQRPQERAKVHTATTPLPCSRSALLGPSGPLPGPHPPTTRPACSTAQCWEVARHLDRVAGLGLMPGRCRPGSLLTAALSVATRRGHSIRRRGWRRYRRAPPVPTPSIFTGTPPPITFIPPAP